MRGFPFAFWDGVAPAAPTLASFNYSQGDTLGGGQSIVLNGANLSSASSVIFDVGGTNTSATITGNTSTTVTVTLPAHAAGSVTVRVTTPGGNSNTIVFEFWDPTTISASLLIDKGYTGSAPWVPRSGSNLISAGADPTASSGSAVFTGSKELHYPNINTLMTTNSGFGTSQGTFAAVLTASATATHTAGSDVNAALISVQSSPTFSVFFDSAGWTARAFDVSLGGSVESNHAMAANSAPHIGIARFADSAIFGGSGNLSTFVDGAAGTVNNCQNLNNSAGTTNLGVDESLAVFLNNASVQAIFTILTRISDANAAKAYKWAQQRYGVV